jgi:hypothetical protein
MEEKLNITENRIDRHLPEMAGGKTCHLGNPITPEERGG